MSITYALMIALAVFIVLMAIWVVKSEEVPKKDRSYLNPNKPYNKAKEMGLDLPDDILPGV